ncbi:MAG TPA: GNAT family N-acetyltransferase [Acidimicrobiales bacterium]
MARAPEWRENVTIGYREILVRLAADEPRTTLALGAVLATTRPRRDVRVLTAGHHDRTVCPLVRAELGQWVAYPFLATADDAEPLAAALNRAPVVSITGGADDVPPLVPHLTRVVRHVTMRRICVPWQPVAWEPPTPATRVATALDLEALYDLYTGYELPFARTTRGMRALLQDAARSFSTIVLDGDRRLDGAVIAASRTPHFIEWSHLTVRPEARGKGYSWQLMARAIALNLASGLGLVAVAGSGNQMTFPDGLGTVDDVTVVGVKPPQRVPGEDLVRRVWFKLDRSRPRRRFPPSESRPGAREPQW